MGFVETGMFLLVKLCFISFALVVAGSTGFNISPSPVAFTVITPTPGTPSPVDDKSFGSNAPGPASQPIVTRPISHPALALPPLLSTLAPQIINAFLPSLPPNSSTALPPHYAAPPPTTSQDHVPSIPPVVNASVPVTHSKSPTVPSLPPINPTPLPPHNVVSPSTNDERLPSAPPTAPPEKEPIVRAPISTPTTPAATPLRNMPQVSPAIPPSVPKLSPSSSYHENYTQERVPPAEPITPVYVAPPPSESVQNPPVVSNNHQHTAPSMLPVPVAPPTSEMPKNSSIEPARPEIPPSMLPDHDVPPVSLPPFGMFQKNGGVPVAAPLFEIPKPMTSVAHAPNNADARHSNRASSSPALSPKSPPMQEYHPSTSSPLSSFYKHHHARNKITSPAPSLAFPISPSASKQHPMQEYHPSTSSPLSSFYKHHHARNKISSPAPSLAFPTSPSASKQLGHTIQPESSHSSWRRHYAPPPLNPASPSKSPSKIPRVPLVPPLALPPPPPSEDCSSTICTEPYTNTPPGSPCGCVMPIQVGLRLTVDLYTFFPLVSELAWETATGVFIKQSQVRIIGANEANQQPDKTVVLVDLVPLGDKFDNTTAFLIYERFWNKQVAIKPSFFGDYEVLYVRYPGLPSSPPASDLSLPDGGPDVGVDSNLRPKKPLGVNVHKRSHKKRLSGAVIAIIVLSSFAAVILCSAAAWILLFKHRNKACQPATPQDLLSSLAKQSGTNYAGSLMESRHSSACLSFGSSIPPYKGSAKTFSSNDIERATGHFDASRILGEGGFGLVYSGVLDDGTKIAVKILKRDDQQGGREFLAEVEMLSRLHHRNLVKLIGICTEEHTRCLVYELIPNGSVESHLHGIHKQMAPLDWGARMKIALGAARGLSYLHEDSSPRVIHRDFKSSNILLEDDFTPKVSDFGLARTALDEENRHISTRVMGTFGYVAPEYAMTGHLLVKSDVYSYGVVLLELLTGRKPVDMSQPPGQENLVTWARPFLSSKEGLETIIDPSLGPNVPSESAAKVAAIASMCVQPEVSHRPFMGEVVQALKLICSEYEEASEVGSRNSSQEEISIDIAAGASITSGQLPNPLHSQYSVPSYYDSEPNTERGLSPSDLFSTSARLGRREHSGSFRRHSSSGPSGNGRGRRFWQRVRRLSGGSVSEHGVMLRLWPGSY